MTDENLRVLVVEDDPLWSGTLIDLLLLHQPGVSADVPRTLFVDAEPPFASDQAAFIDESHTTVDRAADATFIAVRDLHRTWRLMNNLPAIHMVTMDMELAGPYAEGMEKEGLHLLGTLNEEHPEAVSLVVSGRAEEADVARKSIVKHGAIDAVRKGDDLNRISETLLATFFLAEVRRLKSAGKLDAARERVASALQAVDGMTEETRDIFRRHLSALQREVAALSSVASETDEISGLPNARIVTDKLRALRQADDPWALGIILLDGMPQYEDAYGLHQRIQVVKTMGLKLQSTTSEHPVTLLGYLGEGRFVIIAEDPRSVQAVFDALALMFRRFSQTFYDQMNPAAADQLLSLRFVQKNHRTHSHVDMDVLLSLSNKDVDHESW